MARSHEGEQPVPIQTRDAESDRVESFIIICRQGAAEPEQSRGDTELDSRDARNIPGVVVYSGPMRLGRWRGQDVTIQDA